MTAPTLTMFAEGRLCTAGPCRGRGAVLREFPAPPPGGGASLPWGGPAGGQMTLRHILVLAAALFALAARAEAAEWDGIVAKARGQTVNFNAWAGDEKTNAFIAWVGAEVARRYGVAINHVKLKDTAEAATRVVAEKSAGRDRAGAMD